MISIGFAMAACMGWGIADFIGGLKSRDVPTLTVIILSNAVGLCVLGSILASSGRPFMDDPNLIWAIPAGLLGIGAMYLLYRSLAIGVMSILAPVSSAGVILPVIWGIYCGETLHTLTMTGILAAFLGIILATIEPGKKKGQIKWTKGLFHALGAAVCTGLYFILIDNASQNDPFWASMILRISTFIFLIPLILIVRSPVKIRKNHLPLIILMGVMDALASFSFALASNSGLLSIAAVVSSLYPAVTIVLSGIIIKEKMNKVQSSGVMLAITGVVLISGF